MWKAFVPIAATFPYLATRRQSERMFLLILTPPRRVQEIAIDQSHLFANLDAPLGYFNRFHNSCCVLIQPGIFGPD